MPFPEELVLSAASENDLNVFKQEWPALAGRTFYADKAYTDTGFFQDMNKAYKSEMLTPVKVVKGMPQTIWERDKAANDLFSTAVSRIRQPIESRVRPTKGLLVHLFGKIAAAFIYLIF